MLELTKAHLTKTTPIKNKNNPSKKRGNWRSLFKDLIEKRTEPGLLLVGLRRSECLTQAQLAKMIGVSQTNICSMENGRRPISKKVAQKLAAIFGMNYQRFL